LDADEVLAVEPGDLAVAKRIGEKWDEAEARDRGGGEAGDKIAADAVARVAAGFDESDGDAGAAKSEAEREAGEAAADDLDGARGTHA
jgi:hypothetical protein